MMPLHTQADFVRADRISHEEDPKAFILRQTHRKFRSVCYSSDRGLRFIDQRFRNIPDHFMKYSMWPTIIFSLNDSLNQHESQIATKIPCNLLLVPVASFSYIENYQDNNSEKTPVFLVSSFIHPGWFLTISSQNQ